MHRHEDTDNDDSMIGCVFGETAPSANAAVAVVSPAIPVLAQL
jgi:hypothetical protein